MVRNKHNTPGIIKYPFWRMAQQNSKAMCACVNYGEVWASREIGKRLLNTKQRFLFCVSLPSLFCISLARQEQSGKTENCRNDVRYNNKIRNAENVFAKAPKKRYAFR